jgi:nucleoside-diphosphate-sugar epimerase
MSRRAIVLGAGGFLGRAVYRALVDAPECGAVAVQFRKPPILADLLDGDAMWRAIDLAQATPAEIVELVDFAKADVVVNCTGATFGSPRELRVANVGVVANLAIALSHRPGVHLIHLGSAAEYGAQWPERPIAETAVAQPVSDYGATKLDATRHLLVAAQRGDVNVTVLRVFNPIGRGSAVQSLPGRAAREIDAALRRGDEAIHLGNLESWRDYVDTRDVAAAVVAAMASVPAGGAVFNVGSGEAMLTRELVGLLAFIAGYTGTIIESDDGSSRSARVPWQRADITTTSSCLGWRPQHTIDASLRDLWSGVREGIPA